jgi:transcriptional regulator with XRE-family HTH domain
MKERMKEIRKVLGLSQYKIVEGTGLSHNSIALIEGGKNKKPNETTIKAICDKHGINPVWLKTGEGEMFLPKPKETYDIIVEDFNGLREDLKACVDKFVDVMLKYQKIKKMK